MINKLCFIIQVNTLTSANMFRPFGIDNAWDLEAFKEGFQIKINQVEKEYMQFDMIGERTYISVLVTLCKMGSYK